MNIIDAFIERGLIKNDNPKHLFVRRSAATYHSVDNSDDSAQYQYRWEGDVEDLMHKDDRYHRYYITVIDEKIVQCYHYKAIVGPTMSFIRLLELEQFDKELARICLWNLNEIS